MPTDIEKLEAVLGVARKSLVSLFTSYRKVLDSLDIMTLLIRKMKEELLPYEKKKFIVDLKKLLTNSG